MKKLNFTTDFADELYSRKKEKGIVIKKSKNKYSKTIWVNISESKNEYGKEVGNYITIECNNVEEDKKVYKEIAKNIKSIMKLHSISNNAKILVAGLGNGQYLSDAIGPKVCEKVIITSHILRKESIKGVKDIASITPGVMANTGLESSDIIATLIKEFDIDLLIVIDSLATRSVDRLFKTFQLSDTGISPGSGVNNKRKEITYKTMGIPVISLGVATVVDSRTLILSALEALDKRLSSAINKEVVKKVLFKKENNLVLTSKEIDRIIKVLSSIIADGINYALNPMLMQKST